MLKKLYWISLSYATFGVITTNDIVTSTAPIAKWMMGKNIEEIKNWVTNKKGKIDERKL